MVFWAALLDHFEGPGRPEKKMPVHPSGLCRNTESKSLDILGAVRVTHPSILYSVPVSCYYLSPRTGHLQNYQEAEVCLHSATTYCNPTALLPWARCLTRSPPQSRSDPLLPPTQVRQLTHTLRKAIYFQDIDYTFKTGLFRSRKS